MKNDTVNSGKTMDLFQSLHMIEHSLEIDQQRVIAQFLATSSHYLRTNTTIITSEGSDYPGFN